MGTYSFMGKSILWSIPVLIGIYQLIAMKYFELNPIIPLITYFILITITYIILRTNNIKIALNRLSQNPKQLYKSRKIYPKCEKYNQ
jgi:ethanolamine transporter EutH